MFLVRKDDISSQTVERYLGMNSDSDSSFVNRGISGHISVFPCLFENIHLTARKIVALCIKSKNVTYNADLCMFIQN